MAIEVAVEKRIKIGKYQQEMIGMVLVAAIVLGVSVVLAVFFFKYIMFNATVLSAKDEAIKGYNTAISSAAALRSTVINEMAMNEDLESVGRGTVSECYGADNKKIDFSAQYQEAVSANDDEAVKKAEEMIKTCSALRVIPDALPASQNTEALMSSLDQIFKLSGWEPESLAPSGTSLESSIPGVGVIPVSLSVEANTATTHKVLENIEKSIRSFDINSASISWSDDNLELSAQASAYYTEEVGAKEESKTLYASKEAQKATTGTTSTTGGTQ